MPGTLQKGPGLLSWLQRMICHILELPWDSVALFPECGSPAPGSGAPEPVERRRLPVAACPSELLCPAASIPRTMKAAGSAHSSCIRWIPGRTPTPPSCPRRRPAASTKSSVSGCCARQPAHQPSPPHRLGLGDPELSRAPWPCGGSPHPSSPRTHTHTPRFTSHSVLSCSSQCEA